MIRTVLRWKKSKDERTASLFGVIFYPKSTFFRSHSLSLSLLPLGLVMNAQAVAKYTLELASNNSKRTNAHTQHLLAQFLSFSLLFPSFPLFLSSSLGVKGKERREHSTLQSLSPVSHSHQSNNCYEDGSLGEMEGKKEHLGCLIIYRWTWQVFLGVKIRI